MLNKAQDKKRVADSKWTLNYSEALNCPHIEPCEFVHTNVYNSNCAPPPVFRVWAHFVVLYAVCYLEYKT